MSYKQTPYNPELPYGYPEDEFYDSLRRAFVDGGADFVVIDSIREKFLYTCVSWGQEKGFLKGLNEHTDGQSTVWEFRPTEKGLSDLKAHCTYESWIEANVVAKA